MVLARDIRYSTADKRIRLQAQPCGAQPGEEGEDEVAALMQVDPTRTVHLAELLENLCAHLSRNAYTRETLRRGKRFAEMSRWQVADFS